MIPNLYKKEAIPNKIPKNLEKKIREFKTSNKKEFIKKSFDYLTSKYKTDRVHFITKLFDLYKTDLNSLWGIKGFIYCTQMNYLLRVMLVKSKLFQDSDIELMPSNTWHIIPHQYLRIKLNDKDCLNVDPWAFNLGIGYGDFAHGFHAGSIFPRKK